MSARGAPSGAIRRWRRFAQVVGVRLHYVERGSGTPLVMRHGVGSMATELMLSPLFSFAAARYRVIAVDRPGYGYSTRPRGRLWTPQAQATLVRQLLVQLGVERPVVFGYGYGALVALSLRSPTRRHCAAWCSPPVTSSPRSASTCRAPATWFTTPTPGAYFRQSKPRRAKFEVILARPVNALLGIREFGVRAVIRIPQLNELRP